MHLFPRLPSASIEVKNAYMVFCEPPGDEHAPLLREDKEDCSYGSVATVQENSLFSSTGQEDTHSIRTSTPLSTKQLLVVFVMRLAEPIAYSQLFPYINEMMEHVGVIDDPRLAGYYSGIMESSFAIAEFLTVMKWGTLSDNIGRKPVLLFGFFGAMLSTFLFGFSRSFLWALSARCLAGALSGNITVLLSAVGDMTDETNQARAYAIFGIAYNLAQMAGPFIGGTFANPVVTFPSSFGRIGLFREFPFLLPCVICALITLIAAGCCVLFFEETLHRDSLADEINPAASSGRDGQSAWQIATSPLMLSVLRPFFLLSFLNTSLLVVFALFAYTPIVFGGLSRNPEEIGLAIAIAGIAGAIIQVIILPELQLRFGTMALYKFFMSLWPLIYLLFPVINAIALYATSDGINSKVLETLAIWIGAAVLLSLNRLASMAYSLNLILTKSASPSSAVLGKVFALNYSVNCVARAIAPSFVSSLFAFSREYDVLGGNLVWVVMCAISLLGIWATCEARDGSVKRC